MFDFISSSSFFINFEIVFYIYFNMLVYFMMYVQRCKQINRVIPGSVGGCAMLQFVTQFNLLTIVYLSSMYVKLSEQMKYNVDSPLLTLLKLVIGCQWTGKMWFYAVHYIAHHKLVYKYVHYYHHRWILPDPRSTLYAHPVENILCNLGPVLIPVYLFNVSRNGMIVWCIILMINSILAHSGPYNDGVNTHDLHHVYRVVNYGAGVYIDKFLGTDRLK